LNAVAGGFLHGRAVKQPNAMNRSGRVRHWSRPGETAQVQIALADSEVIKGVSPWDEQNDRSDTDCIQVIKQPCCNRNPADPQLCLV
jgi:hypothetical protein